MLKHLQNICKYVLEPSTSRGYRVVDFPRLKCCKVFNFACNHSFTVTVTGGVYDLVTCRLLPISPDLNACIEYGINFSFFKIKTSIVRYTGYVIQCILNS